MAYKSSPKKSSSKSKNKKKLPAFLMKKKK